MEVAVCPLTVTDIIPVVAAGGTVTVSWLDVPLETDAIAPLNLTTLVAVRRLKFVPEIITWSPGLPFVGEKLVIVGGSNTIKGRLDVTD
jgi:hypothetical protein